MMIYRSAIAFLILSIFLTCDGGPKVERKYSTILTRKRTNTDPHTFTDLSMADCKNFAVLMSANKLSKKLKKSKDWVITHYQIPIYSDTLTKGHVIGHVLPGSHCYIVKQTGPWFFVQSPGINELGWLHQEFVVGFVKKNPKTLLPCPK